MIPDGEGESITERMQSAARSQSHTNREKLISMIDAAFYCGRQSIALRILREIGPLNSDDHYETDANSHILVRLIIRRGDNVPGDHV